ncbi:hypothetical protein D3C79_823090 [compost metagenome]
MLRTTGEERPQRRRVGLCRDRLVSRPPEALGQAAQHTAWCSPQYCQQQNRKCQQPVLGKVGQQFGQQHDHQCTEHWPEQHAGATDDHRQDEQDRL